MTIIVKSMYNFVNCLQFNIRYEKVRRPAPVGGALVLTVLIQLLKMAKCLVNIFIYINQPLQILIVEIKHYFSDDCTAIDGQVY